MRLSKERIVEMAPIFIIAEAGVNHNGSVDIAKRLVKAAKEAGADAVKFQTFKAESLLVSTAPKAAYQLEKTARGESQFEMIKGLELSEDDHRELMESCESEGITFLSTPFDLESIDLLNSLGLSIFKIPSGEITNLPYLRKVGGLRKRVILSTGMSTLAEIESALQVLSSSGTVKSNITVLHAITEYPAPMEEVNLRAMITIRDEFGVAVGYSDHTQGIEVALGAAALGAQVIEKHLTLDRSMEGPDHSASIEPGEFKAMVDAIRNIELALGALEKKPSPCEAKNILIVRKSIVAAVDISSGEIFTEDNLAVKRPATGISPMLWDSVVGEEAKRDFKRDEEIEL